MPEIKKNTYGQRILVIDDVISRHYREHLNYQEFDAVYIDIDLPANMDHILKRINPITVNESVYKPFFAPRALQGRIGLCDSMIDAYISSIDEHEVLATIENIQHWTTEYNVPRQFDNINNHNLLILRMFRYYISRNHLILRPEIVEKSAMGIAYPLCEYVHSWGLFHLTEYFAWLEMGNIKGWLAFRKTVYRTHKCAKCQHSHLIYLETCPNCGSNVLDYEPVIHHFPCANISPEHTYSVGGQLICPKCHKQLRHVGIDYDRPAALYFCRNCGKSFLHPDTKALCTNCGTISDVQDLYPHDVHEIEITQDGIRVLTKGEHAFSPYNDYFNNYMPSEAFQNRLEMIANRKLEGDVIKNLVVIQVWMTDSKGEIYNLPSEFVNAASRRLSTFKMSSTANTLFIQYTVLDGDTQEMTQNNIDYIKKRLHILAVFLKPGMTMHYGMRTLGEDVAADRRFMQSWRTLLPDPDANIHYDDVEHPEGITPIQFIIQKSSERTDDTENEIQHRAERDEQIKEELTNMQERPRTMRIIGYLSWGFLVLAIVATLAAILGYYLWLK